MFTYTDQIGRYSMNCLKAVKARVHTGCGHGVVLPSLNPSLNIRTCAAPKFHSKFCQESKNYVKKFLQMKIAKFSQL